MQWEQSQTQSLDSAALGCLQHPQLAEQMSFCLMFYWTMPLCHKMKISVSNLSEVATLS